MQNQGQNYRRCELCLADLARAFFIRPRVTTTQQVSTPVVFAPEAPQFLARPRLMLQAREQRP